MRRLLSVSLVALLSACSGMLPRGESRVESGWESYDAAHAAFARIVPFETREAGLAELGFAPEGQPNVRVLNHADIAERFTLLSVDPARVPKGLEACLDRCEACYGYEFRRRVTRDRRHGSFPADFFNFRRRVETRGWEFEALVVLVDGLVVYKLWSGTREILEHRDKTNPLGPLQGIGPDLAPSP